MTSLEQEMKQNGVDAAQFLPQGLEILKVQAVKYLKRAYSGVRSVPSRL